MVGRVVNKLFRKNLDWVAELGLETPEDLAVYLDTELEKALINHRRKLAGKAPLFLNEEWGPA